MKPGEEHRNKDGVCVASDEDNGPSDSATVDPAEGDVDDSTTVKTKTGFESDISGLDSNDLVEPSNSNEANVSGTGGFIQMQNNSKVSITHTETSGASAPTMSLWGAGELTYEDMLRFFGRDRVFGFPDSAQRQLLEDLGRNPLKWEEIFGPGTPVPRLAGARTLHRLPRSRAGDP